MAEETPDSQEIEIQEEQTSAHHMLRRLQEHSRSNIPAMMANRSMSSFTLQEDPLPAEALDQVLMVVYPQDPFVGEPEVRSMSTLDIKSGLMNSRVRVQDGSGHPLAQPDADGNYLFYPGMPEFDQINVFYYVTFTLRMYERYARRALPWSFPAPRINVDPRVGDQANAFYNEQDRLIGFHRFKLDGKITSTAHSADIISHETAHAVLDGIRDLYNESFGLGPTAFHESFGDMTAMLVALHDDSLIRRLLDWTGGDLRLDNFVSMVAEHLTEALKTLSLRQVRTQTAYLRNAINDLHFKPFDDLLYAPERPEFDLGRQSHNYSRLFTGAFYDIFAEIYEYLNRDMPQHIAIYRARDTVGNLLITAIELGPVGEFDFSDMARAFIAADHILYEGRYRGILKKVFDDRGLLVPAQVEAWVKDIKNIPNIRLPEAINTALASALFLEEQVLPALKLDESANLIPMAAYRNAKGYAYLTYFTSRRMVLKGAQFQQFDGAQVDVFGGLTLMFDAKNQLRCVFYRPVIDEDLRQINILTSDLIAAGLIVNSIAPDINALRYAMPEGLFLTETQAWDQPGETKLVKFPVCFDPVPEHFSSFVTYLHELMDKNSGT